MLKCDSSDIHVTLSAGLPKVLPEQTFTQQADSSVHEAFCTRYFADLLTPYRECAFVNLLSDLSS
jgi:hypothetical protein